MNPGEQAPKQEIKLTPEAKEIISLFQQAIKETNEQEQDRLFQEFYMKLNQAVTPRDRKPKTSEMLYYMKDVALGKSRDKTLYIGSGTSGQRIYFQNHIVIPSNERDKIARLAKDARIIEAGEWVEAESIDGKPRWMRYSQPGGGQGGDWELGKEYWNRYMKTFGEEIVDLLQEIE